jgi:hypothetical protein
MEASGNMYSQADIFLSELHARLENEIEERRRSYERYIRTVSQPREDLKAIEDFQRDPRYLGDNTRIDLAYAICTLPRGTAVSDVNSALRSRDLSHKGNERRLEDYVERTIRKALVRIDRVE